MKYSIKIKTKTGKKYTNGKNMLFLRVIVNRHEKFYSLGTNYACSDKEWNSKKEQFFDKFEGYENANAYLASIKNKANRVLIDLELEDKEYTIHDFDTLYKTDRSSIMVIEFYKIVIKGMIDDNYGSARVFIETRNSIKSFLKDKKKISGDFPLSNINVVFLKEYEKYLRRINTDTGKPQNKDTSISVRMRNIRRLFNIAREEYSFTHYPFNKYTLKHLDLKTKKRALKEEDIKKIFALSLDKYSRQHTSLLYFKFMFYCRGMNFTDLAKLKKTNIINGNIDYTRSKNKKDDTLPLIDKAKDIVDYFKSSTELSDYIFPILLPNHTTQKQKKDRIKTILGRVNKDLKKIASEIEMDVPLSSYYSRHSFATLLKYMGVPIAQISELLNHDSIRTTEIYLDRFVDSELDNVANKMFEKFDDL